MWVVEGERRGHEEGPLAVIATWACPGPMGHRPIGTHEVSYITP